MSSETAIRSIHFDWSITREKVEEAVRLIVKAARPLPVVAFGSWARGQNGPDSDIDLAVILDGAPDLEVARFLRSALKEIQMQMDILAVPLSSTSTSGTP